MDHSEKGKGPIRMRGAVERPAATTPARLRSACVWAITPLHSQPMGERRQVPRYLLGVAAKLSQPVGGAVSNVTVVTLGIHGCSIEGSGAPAIGQRCALRIEWRGAEIRAEAEVTWKTKDARVGFRFLSLKEESQKLLRELCATLRLQPLAPLPPEPD